MDDLEKRGFTVHYVEGVYEITRDARLYSPKLYYSQDPEGANGKLICAMEDIALLLPSPLPGERLYFFLERKDGSILTAASRGVEITGVENFRDMGGNQTSDGRTVKWGRFFRGGPLNGLGSEQRAAIDNLGLKRVFDYRTEKEHVRVPDECPNGAECIWSPAVPAEKRFQDFADRDMMAHLKTVNSQTVAEDVFQLFMDLYSAMPFQSDAFGPMLLSLDSIKTVPLYQHCSAGKDRTGVGSALLLLALGVPEETVVEDYLLSRVYRKEINRCYVEKLVAGGISKIAEELANRMMNVIEDLIESALSAIRLKYTSFEAFFLGEYGITGEQLVSWRNLHTY